MLQGEHDFASFGRPMQAGETTVRVIHRAEWCAAGQLFTFDVIGNAFLRGMVRSLVGNMLRVGSSAEQSGSQWTKSWLAEVLAARDRSLAAPPAPGCGLCLMHIEY